MTIFIVNAIAKVKSKTISNIIAKHWQQNSNFISTLYLQNMNYNASVLAIPVSNLNSAHTDGGPRSRVCTRETLCSAPHWHERKFSVTRVCRITFKHLPELRRAHIQRFRNLKISNKHLKTQKTPLRGPEGVPNILGRLLPPFLVSINTLYSFRSLAKSLLLLPKKA